MGVSHRSHPCSFVCLARGCARVDRLGYLDDPNDKVMIPSGPTFSPYSISQRRLCRHLIISNIHVTVTIYMHYAGGILYFDILLMPITLR